MNEKEILAILQETQDFDYENTDDMLLDSAINIYSLAIYIANFDEAKQQEILDELI